MKTQNAKTRTKKSAASVLPEDKATAIRHLTKLTKYLIDIAEKECQAILQQDMMAFSIIQFEKEKAAEEYRQSSIAFRTRIEEFRGTDSAILNNLERLQTELAHRMQSNGKMIDNMRTSARQNTQSTLFTVQQLAQIRPVFMPTSNTSQNGASQ